MKANDAKELRQLRDENLRLKRMVADRELQIELLKEISRDAPIDCQVAATQRSQS
jgi:hypothetical protein